MQWFVEHEFRTADDPFKAIQEEIAALKQEEYDNLDSGLHHIRGQTDSEAIRIRSEYYLKRQHRLWDLEDLVAQALPAGIDAGFGGEAVRAWLISLYESVKSAAYWNESYEGDPTNDTWACCHLQGLFDKVLDCMAPLMAVAFAFRHRRPSTPAARRPRKPIKPRWDKVRRELWYGDHCCKRFRQRAPNQETILDVFQEEGWPARIDDPLPGSADMVRRQRLADTVRGLNSNSHIQFELDGTTEGVIWEPKDQRA
jgi:hypothetical protein